MSDALVLQQPSPGAALPLFLLFHGEGGQPADLAPLGRRLAEAFSQAAVLSLCLPREPAESEALAQCLSQVQRWQAHFGVPPAATAVLGFARGGTLVLRAGLRTEACAGRFIALAPRFDGPVAPLGDDRTLHLVHGKDDPVVPYRQTVEAAERLISAGADLTADVLPGVGHALTEEVIDAVLDRLQRYIPRARWREAMAAAQAAGEGR